MFGAQTTPLTARGRARWENFSRDRRGAAAIEFAMIAAPFLFLIFGLIEVCMIFIMSSLMEHAVSEASRPLRTGEAQNAAMSLEDFRQSVCLEFFGILECGDRLSIDVRTIDSFSDSPTDLPVDEDGNIEDEDFGFDAGGANDIVTVRVFYAWDLITPFISKPMQNMSGNRHLLSATAVFRNEPFGG